MTQHFPAIIVVFPVLLSFIIFVAGYLNKRLCYPLAILALSVCVLSATGIMTAVMNQHTIHYWLGGWKPPWGIEYLVDHLNALMTDDLADLVIADPILSHVGSKCVSMAVETYVPVFIVNAHSV